jgi:dCMP deaminase
VAVSEKGRVLATGYNGFPRGINDSEVLYQDREYKYSRVVHAEMNCIYNATYNGVCLDGSTMYIWGLPMCSDCAKGAIQVGVRAVYFDTEEEIPDQWLKSMETTIEMFGEVGVEFRRLHIE